MQLNGDNIAVYIIKIDSELKCTGILDSCSSPSHLRMQRDITGNRHVDMWINEQINSRSYSGGRRLQVCEMVIPIS